MFIDVKDLVKTYGEGEAKVFALDHAGLELEKGKICVILGPYGSGKSTLLNMLVAMGGMVYALIGIGMIVCIASLYATVNMMLSENRHTISMLKVLGYDNARIDRMTILSNHLLLVPGIALGALAAWGVMAWYARSFVEVERLMIPATLRLESLLLTALITVCCYFISLLLVRRRIDRVDMVESLKDNRE